MEYINLKISYHSKQAEQKYKKALEFMLEGNTVKSEHFMRQAHGHNKNIEFYTKELNKAQSILFFVQG